MKVCNVVQKAVTKTALKIKEGKKAKWLSEEALHISEKRKEVKSKGERERLEIFSRKLEITREHFMQRWAQ